MTAGLNVLGTVYRMTSSSDDEVGGAQVTGTVAYTSVRFRLQETKPSNLLLQQGFETQRVYTAIVHPGTLDIRENDHLQITFPPNHHYINDRFRVMGVQYNNVHPSDRRNYLKLYMQRSQRAHAEAYQ